MQVQSSGKLWQAKGRTEPINNAPRLAPAASLALQLCEQQSGLPCGYALSVLPPLIATGAGRPPRSIQQGASVYLAVRSEHCAPLVRDATNLVTEEHLAVGFGNAFRKSRAACAHEEKDATGMARPGKPAKRADQFFREPETVLRIF